MGRRRHGTGLPVPHRGSVPGGGARSRRRPHSRPPPEAGKWSLLQGIRRPRNSAMPRKKKKMPAMPTRQRVAARARGGGQRCSTVATLEATFDPGPLRGLTSLDGLRDKADVSEAAFAATGPVSLSGPLWDTLRARPRRHAIAPGYGRGVSWSATARRVRDGNRPIGQRANALHSLLANHHASLGFAKTRKRLRRLVGVGLGHRWTEAKLLTALQDLGESRTSRALSRGVCAAPASGEGWRTAQADEGDVDALHRPEWLKDIHAASDRHPSRRERRQRPP